MPDFKQQKRGFMMEPKGVYKKYTCKRGMPKYGLVDPNEAPTMKTKHLAGTEREHVHNERPSHGNTEEAHGPMQAGQTAAQIVRRERLMTKKRTKAEAKAEAIEGGFPEEKANKVFAKHKKGLYKHGKYAMRKDLPTATDTVNAYVHHTYTNPYKADKVGDKTYDSARKLKGYKPTKSEMERSLKNMNKNKPQ